MQINEISDEQMNEALERWEKRLQSRVDAINDSEFLTAADFAVTITI